VYLKETFITISSNINCVLNSREVVCYQHYEIKTSLFYIFDTAVYPKLMNWSSVLQ